MRKIDILDSKCRLRHEQVKTKRRKNPDCRLNGYFVKCEYCIFYKTEICIDYKDEEE